MNRIYLFLLVAVACLSFEKSAKAQCTSGFTFFVDADTVDFTDASTASFGSIVSWAWNFGDGSFSTTQNPSHVYAACGIYNVSLTIVTSAFCSDTYNTSVTVMGGITPSYTYTVDTTSGDVSFQASPLGLNLNYAWDFGDGGVDSTVAPTHTYPTGTYNVCLTVWDDDGLCTATVCDSVSVYVSPTACASTFNANDGGTGNVGFTVSPFSFGLDYFWDFGDGNNGTGAATFHTYATAGSYYVCLTAIDSATMCTSTWCDSVILAADPTACNFTFTYFDNNGDVGFTASNPFSPASFTWDFGDGNSGTGAVTSHTYASSGIYYVCATINDTFNGCTNTYCDSVNVSITGIAESRLDPFALTVYPNPARDHVTLSWSQQTKDEVSIDLFDLIGNKIQSYTWPGQNGKNQMMLETSGLGQGVYVLKLSSFSGISSKMIVLN